MQADGYCINSESCELSLQKKLQKNFLRRKTILYYPQTCIIKSCLLLKPKNKRSSYDTESLKQYIQLLFFPIHF